MDEENIWYVNDEIGAVVKHSDEPNLKMYPFIYSPNNMFEDPDTLTYTVRNYCLIFQLVWPSKDVPKDTMLSRDFLVGATEEQFRSARLSVWFNTPENYFKKEIRTFDESNEKTFRKLNKTLEEFEKNQIASAKN
jgi:tubulin--tyrosine ligase-like protein 12